MRIAEYKGYHVFIYETYIAINTKTGYEMRFASAKEAKAYIDKQVPDNEEDEVA